MAEDKEVKEWTIMFYFASDNPLAPGVVSQLKAIKEAGFHPQANVIAQFDPRTEGVPSHIFDVNLVNKLKAGNKPLIGFTSNDPFVRNLVFDKLWLAEDAETRKVVADSLKRKRGRKIVYDPPIPPANMAYEPTPKAALAKFLAFCKDNYRARHYMLFILGHGLIVGNDLFLFDENTPDSRTTAEVVESSDVPGSNNSNGSASKKEIRENPAQHSVLLRDLGEVLRGFKDSIGDSGFELVGFHSCSMSGLEVAYEIKDTANYMMGSQGPAFVGSWPYRQILISLFNDLNSEKFRDEDLVDVDSMVDRLIKKSDPVSANLYPLLSENTRNLLDQHDDSMLYHKKIFDALVEELNNLLYDTDPEKDAWVNHVELSPKAKRLKGKPLQGMDRVRLNQMLLQGAFKNEIAKKKRGRGKKKEKDPVKERLTKIFGFCMFNSYDFQMAGYSYDMCLCDLSKLRGEANEIREPLKALSAALIEGLRHKHARKLILLAHLESQSYFQEQYTDLYDFCFRFGEAYDEAYLEFNATERPYANQESKEIPEKIRDACEAVKEVLVRGVETDDNRFIVRCEFVGPTYQYSHGLSVFFPWSRPVKEFFSGEYRLYAFKETDWDKFLDEYFKLTMRPLSVKENNITNTIRGDSFKIRKGDFDRTSILERRVVEKIAGVVFNSGGQLSKAGSSDKTGDDCDCPSIKNYPSFKNTDTSDDYEKDNFPISPDFKIQKK